MAERLVRAYSLVSDAVKLRYLHHVHGSGQNHHLCMA